MSLIPLQPSFAAGELAPSLYGRVDLAKYKVGLKESLNGYIYPYGGWSNRPGFKYLANAFSNDTESRLIPFIYSNAISYVLELFTFTDGEDEYTGARILKNGVVLQDEGEDIIIEIKDSILDLDLLCYSQSGNLLYITTPESGVFKISRSPSDETSWTCAAVTFTPSLSTPAGAPTCTAKGTGSGTQRVYYYVYTKFNENTLEESLPSAIGNCSNYIPLTPACWNEIKWTSADSPTTVTGYNVYMLRNGLFGWIGYVKNTYVSGGAVNIILEDDGIAPDISDTPPRSITAFGGYKPEAVSFHKQRSVFGYGQTLWLSKVGNYENMASSYPLKDSDPMELVIASNQYNNIRSIVSMNDLIVFTSGGEFTISADGALTPTSAQVKQLSYWGSCQIQPILAGNMVLFIDRTQKSVRDLLYSQEIDGFKGNDLSLLVPHRLRDYTIKAWAYQQRPNSIVWVVRSDGAMLGLTYMQEQDVVAWHYHETQGEFESVCVIPGADGKDDLYAVVKRQNGRFIEKLMPSVIDYDSIIDCFYLDSGLTYDGSSYGTEAEATITLSDKEGSITITSDEDVFLEEMIGRKITVNGKGVARITAYTSAKEVTALVESDFELEEFEPGEWYITATTIIGLEHLEDMEVGVFGDGSVLPERTVADGQITVSRPVSVCTVGLKYTSRIRTLDLEIPTEIGSSQNMFKNINKVILKVELSRGFKAGRDENNLSEMKIPLQKYGTPQQLYTGVWELNIQTKWDKLGSIVIQQDDPIPLNILSVAPEVNVGG